MVSHSGRDVYRRIDHQFDAAQQQLAKISSELQRLQTARNEAVRQKAVALARLARVRLGELDGERVANDLDAADHAALELLQRRDRARDEIAQRIADTAAQLTRAAQHRSEALATRDLRQAALQQMRERTMQRLAKEEDYATQRAHVEYLTDLTRHAVAKTEQAEADRETKRIPYEADKLFSYLWKRGYHRPDYRAWPLFRTLDQWVARLCEFDTARRDYAMLLEIPIRLRAHSDALTDRATAAAAELAGLEKAALEEDGEPTFVLELEQAQAEHTRIAELLDDLEDQHEALLQSRAALDAGTDPHTQQALATIAEQISREDVLTLQRDAASTTHTTEDDALVRTIAAAQERLEQLDREVEPVKQQFEQRQSIVADLGDLRRRYRQHGFDDDRSVFESGFDIGGLLGGMLEGTLRAGSAWNRMRRFHRHRTPSTSMTGARIAGNILGSLLSGGGSSRSSGGGFRSGGGFGGGGGGGFRTGGGF